MHTTMKWTVPMDITGMEFNENGRCEVRLYSDRNKNISRYSDVSPKDPAAGSPNLKADGNDHFFPVVDADLAEGWEAVGFFEGYAENDFLYINGQTNIDPIHLKHEVLFPSNVLQHWENSIYVHNPSIKMTAFYLRKTIKCSDLCSFTALSPDWNGEYAVYKLDETAAGNTPVYRNRINFSDASAKRSPADNRRATETDILSTENLLAALDGFVTYTCRSVNETPGSPVRGGFYLFHDTAAATYRVPHWMWAWGPSIKLLVEADMYKNDLPLSGGSDLVSIAERAGQVTLDFQEHDAAHPASGLITVRWNTRIDTERGFQQYLSPADSNFLAGWAWIPLYEKTGREKFLKAAQLLAEAESRLVRQYGIPPMDYIEDDGDWKDFTLDEAGFTPEGLAELYRVTGDESVKQTAVDFMDNMIRMLESPEGLWYRMYYQKTKTVSKVESITRGQGWAMEGLLAMDRMIPDSIYRRKARTLADMVIREQQPEGFWFTRLKGNMKENGISEKGTALWSLLLYHLYDRTAEEKYLQSARKALTWCLRNQMDADDYHAAGGIIGESPMSGVVFRPWFPLICLYTCGFAGLAVMEELKLQQKK